MDNGNTKNVDLEAASAFLIALTEHGIPPDIQELLIVGDPAQDIKPGAISKAIKAALLTYKRAGVEFE